MILSHYNNIDFVLSLEINDFIDLVAKAQEKEAEQHAWQAWVTWYPHMEKKIEWNEFIGKMDKTETKNNEVQQGYYINQVGLF